MQQFEQRVCGIDLNREWSNETLIDMLLRLWKLKMYRRILTCCKIAYTPVVEILFQRKSSPQSQKQVLVEEEITDSPEAEKLLCYWQALDDIQFLWNQEKAVHRRESHQKSSLQLCLRALLAESAGLGGCHPQ